MLATAVTGPESHHGEGPCWSPEWGGLRFVDLTRGDLLTLRDNVLVRQPTGHDLATFVRPRTNGGYVIGTRHGIALSDDPDAAAGGELRLLDGDLARMNDGATTPDGQLLAGSMAWDGTSPVATLDLVDASLASTRVLDSLVCSNGIGFTGSGESAYYVDTATSRIDVLDYQNGVLSGRRPFVSIDPELGFPDGLTVDSAGTVWVALWGGNAVHAYDQQGSLVEVIEVPARQVSACTFGGDDLRTLFVTTARRGRPADELEQRPASGQVIAMRAEVSGLPVRFFAE